MPGSHYPHVPDWERKLLDLAPPVLRKGVTQVLFLESARGIVEADDTQAEMLRDLDPAVAQGRTLDFCGDRVGEARGGLGDDEYRRIIRGREAAAEALSTYRGVFATWLALTGATEDRARILTVPVAGKPCVYLEAEVVAVPSYAWRSRAARVLQDAVVYSYEVSAHAYLAGAAFSGRSPGSGSGTSAITIL